MKQKLTDYVLVLSLIMFSTGMHAAIIIDHNCTDIFAIPTNYINQAKSDFRIGYSHTSHGSQLVAGMSTWSSVEGSPFDYSYSDYGFATGVFMADYWACETGVEPCDLGYNGFTGWRDATRQMLNNGSNDRNVVMWSWCGGVSENDAAGINAYLTAMNGLESEYPGVRFIYMTGHLDGSGEEGTLNQMNNLIRNYCNANNKILFDFADIESYDPDGEYYLNRGATDGCTYDDGNWAIEWCSEHSGSPYCTSCDCQHSEPLNCNMKGAAFWWMMARMAGWQSSNPTPTPPPDATPTPVNPTPTPNSSYDMTLEIYLTHTDFQEGDYFMLTMIASNWESATRDIDVYIVLGFYEQYWFWPSWRESSEGFDFQTYTVEPGVPVNETLLEFTWPAVGGSAENIMFIGALFEPDTFNLVGDVQTIYWGYH